MPRLLNDHFLLQGVDSALGLAPGQRPKNGRGTWGTGLGKSSQESAICWMTSLDTHFSRKERARNGAPGLIIT